MKDPMTWDQREAIHRLKTLLVKLNIKSARPPEPIILATGARAILKINGKQVAFAQGVAYAINNSDPLPIIGSVD